MRRLSVTVDAPTQRALQTEATRLEVSVAEVARRALREGLKTVAPASWKKAEATLEEKA